jgi:RHS repeat-associated protein
MRTDNTQLPPILSTDDADAGGLMAEVDDATDGVLSSLLDGLGSVRARADETGAAVGTADWDAWGNLRASSGVGGVFGWTGQQRDAETGLTYLRARDYAPGSARFLTRDPLVPNAGGTQGYNLSAYTANHPARPTMSPSRCAGTPRRSV